MKRKELVKYYKKKEVTEDYDKQREGTEYRKKKRKEELRLFLLLLNKKRGEKVLELGCSSGFLTKHLGKVTAIDTSKEMLKIAKKKNPKAKIIEADMFELPFKKSSFNKVITMRVWNHLPSYELHEAIFEAKRVLTKKGILVFDIEERNMLRRIINFFYKKIFGIKGFKVYQYNLEQVETLLGLNGFDMERVFLLKHRIGRQIIIKARKEQNGKIHSLY